MNKNISFDLWSTLIKGNTTGVKKHEYFYSHFNPLSKTPEEVKSICDWIKIKADRVSESTGITVRSEHIIGNILHELGVDIIKNVGAVELVIQDCEAITLESNNLPTLYDENTLDVLKWLQDNHFTIIGASNTGFLSGKVMAKVLKEMGIYNYFDELVFSDGVGYSKPSQSFFNQVTSKFNSLTNGRCMKFLHVGDNPFADGGYKNHYIINSNNKSILDLKELLEFSLKVA